MEAAAGAAAPVEAAVRAAAEAQAEAAVRTTMIKTTRTTRTKNHQSLCKARLFRLMFR